MGTKSNRDEFPARIRHQIERKSAYRCSNPACLRALIGPSEDFQTVVYMGVVSHICAAAPGGPRYDSSMSVEERTSEENGVLLCKYCAALVDTDDTSYPPEVLRLWKRQAYQRALEQLAAPPGSAADSRGWQVVQELVRLCLCSYQTQGVVSKEARFRSYSGILYQLLFVDLPQEPNYDVQIELWRKAVNAIAFDALEPVRVRTAKHDRSFPHQYRHLMGELQTYEFQPQQQKARLLNLIEATVRESFGSGAAFGLRANNGNGAF